MRIESFARTDRGAAGAGPAAYRVRGSVGPMPATRPSHADVGGRVVLDHAVTRPGPVVSRLVTWIVLGIAGWGTVIGVPMLALRLIG